MILIDLIKTTSQYITDPPKHTHTHTPPPPHTHPCATSTLAVKNEGMSVTLFSLVAHVIYGRFVNNLIFWP